MAKFLDVRVKLDFRKANAKNARAQLEVRRLPKRAYEYFKSVTPIDKGHAKRNTFLRNDTIRANYPYAERLDIGPGPKNTGRKTWSKQAPQGMTKPTIEWIKEQFNKIFGRR
jgi:hypothetical protein